MRPSVIFFDEIDGLAPVRSSRQDHIHSSIVSIHEFNYKISSGGVLETLILMIKTMTIVIMMTYTAYQ